MTRSLDLHIFVVFLAVTNNRNRVEMYRAKLIYITRVMLSFGLPLTISITDAERYETRGFYHVLGPQGGLPPGGYPSKRVEDRVTILPGTTQTGLASIHVVNKYATGNKFSGQTYFRVNYEFISSNKMVVSKTRNGVTGNGVTA